MVSHPASQLRSCPCLSPSRHCTTLRLSTVTSLRLGGPIREQLEERDRLSCYAVEREPQPSCSLDRLAGCLGCAPRACACLPGGCILVAGQIEHVGLQRLAIGLFQHT